MKFLKTTYKLFTLILLLPLTTHAQNEIINPTRFGQRFNVSNSSRLIKATMFLSIDFTLMKQNRVLNLFHDKKFNFITNIIGDIPNIPSEYSSLYFYGSGKKYDTNFVITGDFKGMSILDHVENIFNKNKEISEIISIKSKKYKNGIVHTFKVKINEKNNTSTVKKIYLGEVGHSKFIVSYNLYDVRDGIIQPIKSPLTKVKNNKLIAQFSFFIKKTIHNLGKNNKANDYIYQSKILNELDTAVINLSLKEQTLYLESVLITNNNDKATKVKQIISGIIAYNQLSDSHNEVTDTLYKNLTNRQKSNNIQIGSFIPLKELINSKEQ